MNQSSDPNKLFKALAKLKGIKGNVKADNHETQEKYVHEYNTTVQEISSSLNDNLNTFLVPSAEIRPKITGFSRSAGRRYSEDKWTETQLLLTKVDSLIEYLEMLLSNQEPKPPFGFSSSSSKQ